MLGFVDDISFVLLASLVLMVQSSIDCDRVNTFCRDACNGVQLCLDRCPTNVCGQTNYPIAIGLSVASAAICIFVVFFTYAGRGTNLMQWVSFLLFGIWIAGAGILTFNSPYLSAVAANGYFSTWACFFGSLLLFLTVWRPNLGLRTDVVALLFFFSIVMLIQTSVDCNQTSGNGNPCDGKLIVGIIAAAFSLVLSGIQVFFVATARPMDGNLRNVSAILCFILWVAAAGVLTFWGPYTYAGNAYFATWLCFLFSGAWFLSMYRGRWASPARENQPPPKNNNTQSSSRPTSQPASHPASPAPASPQAETTDEANFCTGCGEKMAPDAQFCTDCGKHK